MGFPTISYMEWVKTVVDFDDPDRVDFTTSGLPLLCQNWSDWGVDVNQMPMSGRNSYGFPQLLEALAQRYNVLPSQVFAAQGASMANFVLLATLLSPGDKVIIELPVYECMLEPVKALGGVPVPATRWEENGWALPTTKIAQLVRQHRAKVVFLSNPHNPGGTFTSDETLVQLADAVGPDCTVLVDEIYREWIINQARKTVALKRSNIVITSSLTKVFGLGFLRGGWAIGPEELITKAYRTYDHMGVVHSVPNDWLISEILRHENVLEKRRIEAIQHLDACRKPVEEFLASPVGQRIHTVRQPFGGFGTWRTEGLDGDTFACGLYNNAKTTVTPGRFFSAPDCVRVAWTRSPEISSKAVNRIAKWLERQ